MKKKRISMDKIKKILRMHAEHGLGVRKIADALFILTFPPKTSPVFNLGFSDYEGSPKTSSPIMSVIRHISPYGQLSSKLHRGHIIQ